MSQDFYFGDRPEFTFKSKKSKLVKTATKVKRIVEKYFGVARSETQKKYSEFRDCIFGACILVPDPQGGYKITRVKGSGSVHKLGELLMNSFKDSSSIELLTSFDEIDFDTVKDLAQKTNRKQYELYKADFNNIVSCDESKKFLNVYLFANGEWNTIVRKNNHKYLLKLACFFKKIGWRKQNGQNCS